MTMKSAVLFVIFSLLAAPGQSAMAGPPDLVLEDFSGNKVPVSTYIGKGKWTLVMLWAHNCPICNQEAQKISFFHEEHKKRDASVLGVSVDGRAGVSKAQRFVDNHLLDFPNLIADLGDDNLHQFGGGPFVGTPTFYVFSPAGELVAGEVGPISVEALEKFIAEQDRAATTK